MKTPIRIAIIIACILLLWYLVVVLARNVAEETSARDSLAPSVLASQPAVATDSRVLTARA